MPVQETSDFLQVQKVKMILTQEIIRAGWDAIFIILFLALVLVLHEVGHWSIFRLMGFKVGLKFNKVGDLEIGRSVHNKISLWKSIPISLGGISLGLLPFRLFQSWFIDRELLFLLFMLYFLMCFGDISTIIGCLNAKDKSQTLMQFNILQWEDYVEDMKKAGEKIEYHGRDG